MSKVNARGNGSRASSCRECGALRDSGAIISARGLCMECGISTSTAQRLDLQRKAGPHYEEWKRAMVDYARRLISS